MISEKKIDAFVSKVRAAAGTNLESVILYGSAVAGNYNPKFSNLNLFCVLRDGSFAALQAMAPAVKWWHGEKQPAPLLMTRAELESSTDVFSIELMDMKQNYRVLFGADVLQGIQIPERWHRAQVEYELREKLILLRQQLLLAGGAKKRLEDLLVRSLSSFVTLFRHVLIALGHAAPAGKLETVMMLSWHTRFDVSAFKQVLDAREYGADLKKLDLIDVCGRYLAAIEQVIAAVDGAPEAQTISRTESHQL